MHEAITLQTKCAVQIVPSQIQDGEWRQASKTGGNTSLDPIVAEIKDFQLLQSCYLYSYYVRWQGK